MKKNSRTQQQIACDGVQTIWLPNTSQMRLELEKTVRKSIDGVVFSGTMEEVAMHMHKNDMLRAMGRQRHVSRVHDSLTDFIATMDGVRVRRPVTVNA